MRLILCLIAIVLLAGCTTYRDGTVVYHRLGQYHVRYSDGTVEWREGLTQEGYERMIRLLDAGDPLLRETRQEMTARIVAEKSAFKVTPFGTYRIVEVIPSPAWLEAEAKARAEYQRAAAEQ
jgi:hypothetical protein